jgi:hypothetical protein
MKCEATAQVMDGHINYNPFGIHVRHIVFELHFTN